MDWCKIAVQLKLHGYENIRSHFFAQQESYWLGTSSVRTEIAIHLVLQDYLSTNSVYF